MSDKFVILVVDDNINNRVTLRALLQNLPNCDILEADSGETALIQTIEHSIHLILLDVQMPIMDGFETARHLQMTERTRHIPIVFVTAVFKSEEFIQRGYSIGAVDYLTKPIDDNLLLNRVKLYQRLFSHQRELELTIDLLQKHEEELLNLKNIAEAANRAKSIFLANMSHELRTPLNAILGFAQLLEHDTQLSEPQKAEVITINHAGQHLLALINDILEIARIETGRIVLYDEPFDLIETLNTVAEMIQVRATAKNVAFRVEYNTQLPHFVRGDVNKLRQVLINLLSNAVKFTDNGEVILRLSINSDERISFTIIDTGVGISLEDQQCLFHAFYQTDAGIAKAEGSGLGLIISREFVRLMGGDISVHSHVGKGSTFSFELALPVIYAEMPVITNKRILGLSSSQAPVRVLVTEDDDDNRQLISRLLENAGFQVHTASNGQEAITAFETWHPHFIWMDMRMPILDGYHATRHIRSLAGGNNVKIAALTASVFKEERGDIIAAGCDDMVFKPLEEQHLLQVMGQLLNLDYRYEETDTQNQSEIGNTQSNLSLLPESLQAELKVAAEQLDLDAINSITEKMQDYPVEVQTINGWMDGFRFDTLLTALNK